MHEQRLPAYLDPHLHSGSTLRFYLPMYLDQFDFSPGKKQMGGAGDPDTAKVLLLVPRGDAAPWASLAPLRLPGVSPVPAAPQQLARTHLEPGRSGRGAAYTTEPQRGPAAPKIPPVSLSLSPQNDSVSPQSAALPGSYVGWQNGAAGGSSASLPKQGGNKKINK